MLSVGVVVYVIPHFALLAASSRTEIRIRAAEPAEVRTISTPTEWYSVTRSGRHVVFVDGNWNMHVVMFREQFQQFANWCGRHSDYVPMKIELKDMPDDPMRDFVIGLCRTHEIPYGSMKFMGSGVIVWLEDGELIDAAHCAVPGAEFYPDGFAALKNRTMRLEQ